MITYGCTRQTASSLLMLICSAGVLACRSGGEVVNAPSASNVRSDTMSVGFTASQTSAVYHDLAQCGEKDLPEIEGTWTPATRETVRLDSAVFFALRAALDTLTARLNPAEYRYQYFGLIRGGHRLILVNGFNKTVLRLATHDQSEWQHIPILLCDAGLGAFQTEYDVDMRSLQPIRFFSRYGGS